MGRLVVRNVRLVRLKSDTIAGSPPVAVADLYSRPDGGMPEEERFVCTVRMGYPVPDEDVVEEGLAPTNYPPSFTPTT